MEVIDRGRMSRWAIAVACVHLATAVGCGGGEHGAVQGPSRPISAATAGARGPGDTVVPPSLSPGQAAGARAAGMSAAAPAAPSATAPQAGASAPSDAAGAGGMAGAASAAGSGGTAGSSASPSGVRLPPVDSVEGNGPFETAILMDGPPSDGWIVYPTELGADGLLHPIFLWGPGGGAAPSNYERTFLRPIASHGFVIFSAVSTGNGQEMIAGLEYLVAENERMGSPFFHKLDLTKVAAGGHSQGSITTFAAAPDKRILTTIHVAGGSFDGDGPSALHGPTAYICGETDGLATGNCMRDFMNTSNVPVFYTLMTGVGHIPAADEGLPAIIAWLRWQIGGEEERRGDFLDPNCEFCTGKWVSQSKNW